VDGEPEIVVSDFESASWYSEGLQFTCTQCGNCCSGAPGYVFVSEEESRAIASFVQMDPREFHNRHTRRVGRQRSLREHDNGDCEFLVTTENGQRVCGIYPVRPAQCRTWPFWESNLSSRAAWEATGRGCPGINRGASHPLPVIQESLATNRAAGLRL
jgi:Fe-S-cluster containining protein